MSEERNREMIKALAYNVPAKIIAEQFGLTVTEVEHFAAEHFELVRDERQYLNGIKEGKV